MRMKMQRDRRGMLDEVDRVKADRGRVWDQPGLPPEAREGDEIFDVRSGCLCKFYNGRWWHFKPVEMVEDV